MPTSTYAGQTVEVNADGFLTNSAQWTPSIGEEIAREVGITPLSQKHWQVIAYCREDAAREGAPPGLRRIAKFSGVPMKDLYQLFPKGPGKLAARIAGLTKPQGCI
jgi:tRNA 2-thiouridine synthesizing protein E